MTGATVVVSSLVETGFVMFRNSFVSDDKVFTFSAISAFGSPGILNEKIISICFEEESMTCTQSQYSLIFRSDDFVTDQIALFIQLQRFAALLHKILVRGQYDGVEFRNGHLLLDKLLL